MEDESFYYRGREDCLRRLPANPSGAESPQERNAYMNGYNSVQQQMQGKLLGNLKNALESYRELTAKKDLSKHEAIDSIKSLTLTLTELLADSLHEPADVRTNLDDSFRKTLFELRQYDPTLEFKIRELYNAVQKSKRFELREGELTKQINIVENSEKHKARRKKN
ncbi:MAG: hypothetical protein WCI72_00280 [archaeon]